MPVDAGAPVVAGIVGTFVRVHVAKGTLEAFFALAVIRAKSVDASPAVVANGRLSVVLLFALVDVLLAAVALESLVAVALHFACPGVGLAFAVSPARIAPIPSSWVTFVFQVAMVA